jgi:hypothetical protein
MTLDAEIIAHINAFVEDGRSLGDPARLGRTSRGIWRPCGSQVDQDHGVRVALTKQK